MRYGILLSGPESSGFVGCLGLLSVSLSTDRLSPRDEPGPEESLAGDEKGMWGSRDSQLPTTIISILCIRNLGL